MNYIFQFHKVGSSWAPGLGCRFISAVLIPCTLLFGLPISILKAESTANTSVSFGKMPEPVLTPVKVTVNKTVPVEPKSWFPKIKFSVSDDDIFKQHVFSEPLVPIGGKTSGSENRALSNALSAFSERKQSDDASAIDMFIFSYPSSPWNLSLYCNLGDFYYRTGQYSEAITALQEAWDIGKTSNDPNGRMLADQALGNLANMRSRIGQVEELAQLLKETEGRVLTGSASEAISGAKEGLQGMRTNPGISFHCGPLALACIRRSMNLPNAYDKQLLKPNKSGARGFKMSQLEQFATDLGMNYEIVKATESSQLTENMLPAVVHWKLDHYAAVLKKKGDKYLIKDQTFDVKNTWVTSTTLMKESSGHFLVPKNSAGQGWNKVAINESSSIIGKGRPPGKDPDETTCEDAALGGGGKGKGNPMTDYLFKEMLVSLHLYDFPVPYQPQYGPSPFFKIMYNQRDANQPAIFDYSNLGPKWTLGILGFVQDDPSNNLADVKVVKLGGARRYTDFNTSTQAFTYQDQRHDLLKRTSSSPISYERTNPDGSKEIYSLSNGVTVPGRKVFLTEIIDPQGNSLTLHYDSLLRLVAVTDATGQVSTLSYSNASHPFLITRITDPFGRYAQFNYNDDGWLTKITDIMGIESSYQYGPGDFINALTTPYGTTRFYFGEAGSERWLEAIDPYGDKEMLEFRNNDVANHDLPIAHAETQVPSGISGPTLTNDYLSERNTFFWDKQAMKMAPGDYSKAHVTHWLHLDENFNIVSGIKESEKSPFESRIWYTYPNQTDSNATNDGMVALPKTISRVLSDGSTQLYKRTYNDFGNITNEIDPESRNFTYVYASNGNDVLEERQTRSGANELVKSATYNTIHRQLTKTDSASETTTYTYNGRGRVATITNAKGEVSTYAYDGAGKLQSITGDSPGAVTSFTYDGFNRIRTRTDSSGHTLTYDYNAMDRVTKITYPDTTYKQIVYDKLDIAAIRDRQGQWTREYYNALRDPVVIKYANGSTINMVWSRDGKISALTDSSGHTTQWKYNERGQQTKKIYANGNAETYSYDNANRLATRTDALSQVTTYAYFKDNKIKSRTYTSAVNPTNNVSFTYDPDYNRIKTIADGTGTTGTGTTTYSYYPVGTSLNGGLASEINGSLSSDVISLNYDELGRVHERAVNGNSITYTYDNLGRNTEEINALGTFTYNYIGDTEKLNDIEYPNGQSATFVYYPNSTATSGVGNGDNRLEEILNSTGSNTLSQFDYEYTINGDISKLTTQLGSSAAIDSSFEYDQLNRLLNATQTQSSAVVKQFAYSYDPVNNRLTERIDDLLTTASYNNLNQLVSTTSGGQISFSGSTNEEAAVTVGGQSALTSKVGTHFNKSIALSGGTHTVNVTATDPSGNATSQNYQVTVGSGSGRSFTFDSNGNLTDDGSRQFAWDAENRLVKITLGTKTIDIEYDGLNRWTRILEKDGATTLNDKRFIWFGARVVEQRNGTATTAIQRYFPYGVQQGSNIYFYTKDHIGSVREVTNSAGTVVARYDYDPYGRRIKLGSCLV